MGNLIETYLTTCIHQLQKVMEVEKPAIQAAATAVADTIAEEGIFYLFGSGHSALIAREALWRAGGLAPALPIPDPSGGDVERLTGFGATLLAHYNLQPKDVIIIISNSGINHLPVEIAMESKARGLTVIGLTSKTHTGAVAPRHPSGKKLIDLADIVIDTHGVTGDAAVQLPGIALKAGATSTVIGTAIIEAITTGAAEILLERGIDPPVIISANIPAGDAHNRTLALKYRDRLVRYEVPSVDAPDI